MSTISEKRRIPRMSAGVERSAGGETTSSRGSSALDKGSNSLQKWTEFYPVEWMQTRVAAAMSFLCQYRSGPSEPSPESGDTRRVVLAESYFLRRRDPFDEPYNRSDTIRQYVRIHSSRRAAFLTNTCIYPTQPTIRSQRRSRLLRYAILDRANE